MIVHIGLAQGTGYKTILEMCIRDRHKADRLRVFSSQFDEDEIPVEELFRTEKQMPLLERTALQMATGKIIPCGKWAISVA